MNFNRTWLFRCPLYIPLCFQTSQGGAPPLVLLFFPPTLTTSSLHILSSHYAAVTCSGDYKWNTNRWSEQGWTLGTRRCRNTCDCSLPSENIPDVVVVALPSFHLWWWKPWPAPCPKPSTPTDTCLLERGGGVTGLWVRWKKLLLISVLMRVV